MNKKNYGLENPTDDVKLSLNSILDLKGRQSVRVTFSLTEQCIDAISIVATQMGIKKKSILENLAEDVDVLRTIAYEIKKTKRPSAGRIKKTFVISRKALSAINEMAKEIDVSRDALIEYSIQRLLPIIDKERRKHELRKEYFERINAHCDEGKKILNDIEKHLGNDDPILSRFSTIINSYEAVKDGIEKFIDKSLEIEDFDSNRM